MHKGVRRALKYTKRFLLGILIFISGYVAAAFILSHIPVNLHPDKGPVTIYIKTNGVHTDIVVPVTNKIKNWSSEVLYSQTRSKDSIMRYVAFGWGDKGFYLETPQWSDLKAGTAFKAAFHLGTSAMHTRFYKSLQESEHCVKLSITEADYRDLVHYIESGFKTGDGHKLLWIAGKGYNDYDAFYEGRGSYSLFYTCNTWANNALKAAHQKAALWTPYDKGIFCHYD